jgi:hypothetical protein
MLINNGFAPLFKKWINNGFAPLFKKWINNGFAPLFLKVDIYNDNTPRNLVK